MIIGNVRNSTKLGSIIKYSKRVFTHALIIYGEDDIMTTKKYRDNDSDLGILFGDIETWFREQAYQVQTNKAEGTWFLQAAKNETWRKVVGASRAFNVIIQGESKDFSVELSTGEWASNLAAGGVAAVLTGGATLIVSGITAGWSKKIEADLWNFIDRKVMFAEKAKSTHGLAVSKPTNTLEEKLKQLNNAFNEGIIDEIAYKAKKLEIEGQIQANQQDIKTQEKLTKLKSLLDAGILSQDEFDSKKAELIENSSNSELDNQISKLNDALASGIITHEEYEQKKALIEDKYKLATKTKQLENAKKSGIITEKEFEQKLKILNQENNV